MKREGERKERVGMKVGGGGGVGRGKRNLYGGMSKDGSRCGEGRMSRDGRGAGSGERVRIEGKVSRVEGLGMERGLGRKEKGATVSP